MMFNETGNSYDEFCAKIISKQIAFVSVELAAKTFLRSITDERINFLGQLSSLGMMQYINKKGVYVNARSFNFRRFSLRHMYISQM